MISRIKEEAAAAFAAATLDTRENYQNSSLTKSNLRESAAERSSTPRWIAARTRRETEEGKSGLLTLFEQLTRLTRRTPGSPRPVDRNPSASVFPQVA